MYNIRTEVSQDGEYTATFLKDKEGRDCRIGNWEGEIIAELQEKLNIALEEKEHFASGYSDMRDKLHRRNLQIADLKKEIENWKVCYDKKFMEVVELKKKIV